MELNIHPILPEERICMGGHNNRELNEKTGCIGYDFSNDRREDISQSKNRCSGTDSKNGVWADICRGSAIFAG